MFLESGVISMANNTTYLALSTLGTVLMLPGLAQAQSLPQDIAASSPQAPQPSNLSEDLATASNIAAPQSIVTPETIASLEVSTSAPTTVTPEIKSIIPEAKVEIAYSTHPTPEELSTASSNTLPPVIESQKIQLPQDGGVTVFGDSLSDNGNYNRITHGAVLKEPMFYQGRGSNGTVWSEHLAPKLNLSQPDQNLAVAGTVSQQAKNQVGQFVETNPQTSPNQIYTVWTGTNDLLGGTNPSASVVTNITDSTKQLLDNGAKNIVIPNSPRFLVGPTKPELNTYNDSLNKALSELSADRPDSNIIPLDITALMDSAIANPTRYGFTNGTQACMNSAESICGQPDQHIFWDNIHPTAKMHQLISNYAIDVLNAPYAIAHQKQAALNFSQQSLQSIENQLTQIRESRNSSSKTTVFVSGQVPSKEQDLINPAMTLGINTQLTPALTTGVAITSGQSTTNLSGDRGTIELDGNTLSLYSNYQQGQFFTSGILRHGQTRQAITRNLQTPGFNAATAGRDSQQLAAQIQTGYQMEQGNLSITPTAGLDYSNLNLDRYSETNADLLNLNVAEQTSKSLRLNLAARLAYRVKLKNAEIKPYTQVSYDQELMSGQDEIQTELATQTGITSRTAMQRGDRSRINIALGLQASVNEVLQVSLGYNQRLSLNGGSDNSFQGNVAYAF
jgi:outer membrane lipase/esterase